MSIDGKKIEKIILEKGDFGHEMRVGRILNRVVPQPNKTWVAHVEHGGSYIDPVTEKQRQFDYRSRIINMKSKAVPQYVNLALECKNLDPDYPFVVCGRPRIETEEYHYLIRRPQRDTYQNEQFVGIFSFYGRGGFVGKSLLPLKEKNGKTIADNDSEIYDRWAQALSSSWDLVAQGIRFPLVAGSGVFIMPLVVVPDDTLWLAQFDEKGILAGQPVKINECDFFVGHRVSITGEQPFFLSHIRFLTCKGLEELLTEFMLDNSHIWEKIFTTTEKKL